MTVIEYEGQTINVDEDGYLVDMEDWNDTVASALAEREGLGPVTYDQLDVLLFMRQYYHKFKFFPIVNSVCKNVHQPEGCVSDEFFDPVTACRHEHRAPEEVRAIGRLFEVAWALRNRRSWRRAASRCSQQMTRRR